MFHFHSRRDYSIIIWLSKIEVDTADLTLAHIWQKRDHIDAPDVGQLHWSRHLRNEISSNLRTVGAKPMQIMRSMWFNYLGDVYDFDIKF